MNNNKFDFQYKYFAAAFLTVFAIAVAFAGQISAQIIRPRLISAAAGTRDTAANEASQISSVSGDGRYTAYSSRATNIIPGLVDNNNNWDVFLHDGATNTTRCLSLAAPNTTGNLRSINPIITYDGRYVFFSSEATNLVSIADNNNDFDLFRADMATGEIKLVSINFAGNGTGNAYSGLGPKGVDASDDGRFVVFQSNATDLSNIADTNNGSDVFVRDMFGNATRVISRNAAGNAMGAGVSDFVSISGDGRIVSFQSRADDLVSGISPFNGGYDVFVRNLVTNQTKWVSLSRSTANQAASRASNRPVLSKDGSRVVYGSRSADLVLPVEFLDIFNVYAYDVAFNANSLVSVGTDGASRGNRESQGEDSISLSISRNGRYVVFESLATNLHVGTSNPTLAQVFRRDLVSGQTELVSFNGDNSAAGTASSLIGFVGASISNDGRFVAYRTVASNLTLPGITTNFSQQIILRDMQTGYNYFASPKVNANVASNSNSQAAMISANGKTIVFNSDSTDLTATDTNANTDVFRLNVTIPRSTISDFDGDGKTDFSVFRPSTGNWYTLPNSGNYIAGVVPFGTNGDQIVPADYTGDGRTDFAVFRPSNSTWYITDSQTFAMQTLPFGQTGDKPVPADYDGDGKTDLAVYRNGTWIISQSSNNQTRFFNFGLASDIPVAADYDGDGSADIAVFRSGIWYIAHSSDNQFTAVSFGQSGDKAITADFDGDGRADISVFRAGVFYTTESRSGTIRAVTWGLNSDIPVIGDYDGDSKSDIAVFRPSEGNWYIVKSSDGSFFGIHWGQNGDAPAPAAFIQ